MTRTTKPASPVRPSNADPVDAWLDVLVAMLSIPRADRQRVRDELEDHLRSRIDDLLIHGMTEPQALQKAVAELGETADLARQLTHAHRPPRTRRRIMMHTALIAIAGSLTTWGVLAMKAGTPPVTSSVKLTDPAEAQPAEARKTLAIKDMPFLEAFRAVTDSFSMLPALDASRQQLYRASDIKVTIDGHFTLEEALKRLVSYDPHGIQDSVYQIQGDQVEIVDARTILERSVTIRRYSVDWVGDHREQTGLFDSVYRIVSQTVEGSVSTVNLVAGALIVSGPPQIHMTVGNLIKSLEHDHSVIAERRAEQRANDVQRASDQLQAEFAQLSDQYVHRVAMLREARSELSTVGSQAFSPNEQERTDAIQRHKAIFASIDRLEFEIAEMKYQLDFLRERLLELQYGKYNLDQSGPINATSVIEAKAPISISGQVQRPGRYELPPGGLSIRRAITAAGGSDASADATLTVTRNGEVLVSGKLAEVLTLEDATETRLLPGDELVITAQPSP